MARGRGPLLAALTAGVAACGPIPTEVSNAPDERAALPDTGFVPSVGDLDAGALPDAGPQPPADPFEGRGRIETLQVGFLFTDGPQWQADRWVFTDLGADRIYAVRPGERATLLLMPAGRATGLALDSEGELVIAEGGRRRLSRVTEGRTEALLTAFEGRRLNSPNDLIVRKDGTVYFTDPHWGILRDPDARELPFNGVFRIDPSGRVHREWCDPWRGHALTARPNGIALAPDERTAYVSDDRGARIMVFDVEPSGALLGPRAEWATHEGPGGLAVDEAGNVFVASSEGIEAFDRHGAYWGVLALPHASNVAFGGEDGRSLFVTGGETIRRIRLTRPGLP